MAQDTPFGGRKMRGFFGIKSPSSSDPGKRGKSPLLVGGKRNQKAKGRTSTTATVSDDSAEFSNGSMEKQQGVGAGLFARARGVARRPSCESTNSPSQVLQDTSTNRGGRRPSVGRRLSAGRRPSVESYANSIHSAPPGMEDTAAAAAQVARMFGSLDGGGGGRYGGLLDHRRPSRRLSAGAGSSADFPPPPPPASSFGLAAAAAKETPANPVVESLLANMRKEDLMDVTLLGREGAKFPTCRFIIACRAEGLKKALYALNSETNRPCDEVALGDYSQDTIEALVEYCFSGEIPSKLQEETPVAAQGLCELADLTKTHGERKIADEAYQMARRLMNRLPSLACVVYSKSTAKLRDTFESYAIQTIQDCPIESLVGDDDDLIRFLDGDCFSKILGEHLEDIDDTLRLRIINRWLRTKAPEGQDIPDDESFAVGKQCARAIELEYLDPSYLQNVVKQSGLFTAEQIEDAIVKAREYHNMGNVPASRKTSMATVRTDVDRVLVTGAGLDSINGLYHREPDSEEIMYTKEEDSDCEESFGLYLWGSTWGIASAMDLSNNFYVCMATPGGEEQQQQEPPAHGWKTEMTGVYPPPTCQFIGASSNLHDDSFGIEEIAEGPTKRISTSPKSSHALPACFASEEALYGN